MKTSTVWLLDYKEGDLSISALFKDYDTLITSLELTFDVKINRIPISQRTPTTLQGFASPNGNWVKIQARDLIEQPYNIFSRQLTLGQPRA